ncbi:MAG: DUF4276 family protein [Planctomycetes bacterium]|nr:DUF4276 family protein [Planctomycetota bacterium]
MKFVLLLEGKTEQLAISDFLKRWLNGQLSGRVGVDAISLGGYGNFRKDCKKRARLFLTSPRADQVILVIGILDLYGPNFYPRQLNTVKERYDWLVKTFEDDVDHEKFRMFAAVHEFEAWLLSQPEILPREVRESLPAKSTRYPERVNFHEPPAKVLSRLYRQRINRNYGKIKDGKLLFRKLSPKTASEKCPYLKDMLNTMLSQARLARL